MNEDRPTDTTPNRPAEPPAETAPGTASEENEGVPRDGVPQEPVTVRNTLARLWSDLYGGLRGALLLRSGFEPLSSAPAGLVVLVAADLVLNLLVSLLLVGGGGNFSFSSIPYFLFYLPLFLLFGAAASGVVHRPKAITGLAAALVAFSIPIEVSHGILEWLAQWRPFEWLSDYLAAPHYYRFFGWWVAASLVFLLRLDGPGGLGRRLRLVLLFLLLVAAPLYYFQRGDLWVSKEGGNESGELSLTDEVLTAQNRLLEEQLRSLLHGRPGHSDLYFVGFAGDASQDVFLKELSATRQLFDSRFGTAGRSVLLVNNPQSATALPFATVGNLERALARVGEVMNRNEDVLFLYLSSHGSRDQELEVNNPPLELKQVTPELLRRMLQKAGIRYKVVVVSACFSGGFIQPLQDDGSLLITAADATHESFGCGFGENYTWFGEAFVGDALRNTFSFTDAFEKSRDTIRKWEEERGETPSNPQIWAGKEIWPVLKRVQEELAQRKGR
ncbi:C13 family peptidase [Geomonas nitrogeniifigens]|uniref:C13 family peptidase n=1 Tax=Geomonas diazotrophica TaxID=2843197 RepID=UPI001C2CC50C|nr:C13 family peptidase [Geomonas nitrogeniifigens]QXE88053.1 C13 family peptidase [Geomonas nitrogeniifigens]